MRLPDAVSHSNIRMTNQFRTRTLEDGQTSNGGTATIAAGKQLPIVHSLQQHVNLRCRPGVGSCPSPKRFATVSPSFHHSIATRSAQRVRYGRSLQKGLFCRNVHDLGNLPGILAVNLALWRARREYDRSIPLSRCPVLGQFT